MLIIGHRGSRGTHPENTMVGLREALRADADMVEFDVRLTRDGIPVLNHDFRVSGTRKRDLSFVRRYTLADLKRRTANTDYPVATLDQALKLCFNKIYINIEIKESSAVGPILQVIERYAHTEEDWDSILLSSFKPLALRTVRRRAPHASLGMLHHRNPLGFLGWHRILGLSAVGFHRLYINNLAIEVAKRLNLFTYTYTVNRTSAAQKLIDQGIDGIVTDYPAQMRKDFELED